MQYWNSYTLDWPTSKGDYISGHMTWQGNMEGVAVGSDATVWAMARQLLITLDSNGNWLGEFVVGEGLPGDTPASTTLP